MATLKKAKKRPKPKPATAHKRFRERAVMARFTQAEHDAIEKAKPAYESMASYVRRIMLEHVRGGRGK